MLMPLIVHINGINYMNNSIHRLLTSCHRECKQLLNNTFSSIIRYYGLNCKVIFKVKESEIYKFSINFLKHDENEKDDFSTHSYCYVDHSNCSDY